MSAYGELLDFWGLDESRGIKVNAGACIREKAVAKLILDERIKPEWIAKAEEPRILVNKIYQNTSDGEELAWFSIDGNQYPAIVHGKSGIVFNFSPQDAINYLKYEKYCYKKRPIFTYMPFHYHKIPFRIQITRLKGFVDRLKASLPRFPAWPEEKSVEAVRYAFLKSFEIANRRKTGARRFWPRGKRYAVVLSHDTDTRHGFERVRMLSDAEDKYGLKSTWNFVTGYYPLDYNLIESLKKEGHEIGWHDSRHDNLLPFLPKEKIEERFEKSKPFFQRFDVNGFRSPSLLTSEALDEVASKYFIYDSSVPDSGVFIPGASDFTGCCTVFPFMRNGLVELPITIPMDCDLQYFNYPPEKILRIWLDKLEFVKKVGGIAVINTHTEPHYSGNLRMASVYDKFLQHISKDSDAWIASSAEAARHWKKEHKA